MDLIEEVLHASTAGADDCSFSIVPHPDVETSQSLVYKSISQRMFPKLIVALLLLRIMNVPVGFPDKTAATSSAVFANIIDPKMRSPMLRDLQKGTLDFRKPTYLIRDHVSYKLSSSAVHT